MKSSKSTLKTRFVNMKKTKEGSWAVDFVLNGKRNRRIFPSERVASKFVDDLNDFIKGKRKLITNAGIEIELGKCIFEMLEEELRLEKISESSYNTYWKWHTSYFAKDFGNKKLNEVDECFLIELRKKLETTGNKKSNGSKFKSSLVLLSKVRAYALKKNYINISSELDIESFIPTIKIKKQLTHSFEDYQNAEDVYTELSDSSSKLYLGILLFNMQLGLRIGELTALKWEDVDFENLTLFVNKTLAHGKNKNWVIKDGTKTNTSRTINISMFCVEILNYIKEKRPSDEFIFCSKVNTSNHINMPIALSSMLKILKKGAIVANLKVINSHNACRKTMATIVATELSKDGVDAFTVAKEIQMNLGHSSMTTTMEHYIFPALNFNKKGIGVFSKNKNKS